ncbi:MAG TPA: amidohydrolase [Verrucomicrobiae bacterium]|nr:amidohydrolase [Verrucomicrobiae bacterium]
MEMTRRGFLQFAGGAAGCLASSPRSWAAERPPAELILTNGAITTMDDARPFATALAIQNGKVTAVGSDAEVAPLAGPATRRIDLAGKGVSPGLIDAHSHLMGFGQMQLTYVIIRPPQVQSFDTLRRALRAAAAERAPGQWIVARGFQEFKEGRWPRREDIDEMVPKHPTLLIHWGGQFGIANSLALQKANLLNRDAKDPYGGVYLRDKRSGIPNGILSHYPAIYSVHREELDEEQQARCTRWAIGQFLKEGVTCVHDNFVPPRYAKTFVTLERASELILRLRVYPYVSNLEQARAVAEKMVRYSGPLARMQGIKLAVDGYALMYDIPAEHKEFAIPMHPQPILEQMVATIHDAGLQADVHAAGDRGVDWVLDAYAKAAGGPEGVRQRRHRIEHFPFYKADSIRRASAMGVPVCEQPYAIDFRVDDFTKKLTFLSKKQIDSMVPLKSMLREGVRLAFGADVPAFPSHRPLDSIRSAMSRTTGEGRKLDATERLTFMEALRIHTLGSAYAAFDENELGSLRPGKWADFVIWNKDLRTIDSHRDIDGLKVESTHIAGRKVFETEPSKA